MTSSTSTNLDTAASLESDASRRWNPWWVALVLVVLATLPYVPALRGPFLYDDNVYVVDNPDVREYSLGALASSYPPNREQQGLYRPLTVLSYALDHALFGMEPFYFHLTNLLLHVATTALVFLWLRRFGHGMALASACLFAVHPAHVEPVAWIVGRAELLSAALVLAGLIAADRRPLWAGPLVLLALLAKEMALTAAALALLPWIVFGRDRVRAWYAAGASAVALGLYLILRWNALGQWTPSGAGQVVLEGSGLVTRGAAFFAVYAEYFRLAFFPWKLMVDAAWAEIPSFGAFTTQAGLLLFALVAWTTGRW